MRIPARRLAAMACALALALPCVAFAATGTPAASSGDKAPAEKGATATGNATEGASQTEQATATEKTGPSEELLAWADGKECGSCHEAQLASTEDEELGASMHTLLKLACVDCHADDALIELHEKAKPDAKAPTKLKKSTLDYALCSTCHTPEALSKIGAESTALTDSEGTVVNPHEVPDVKDHKKIQCQSCHKMHSASKPASTAPTLCQDCHHEDVYECYTCHS